MYICVQFIGSIYDMDLCVRLNGYFALDSIIVFCIFVAMSVAMHFMDVYKLFVIANIKNNCVNFIHCMWIEMKFYLNRFLKLYTNSKYRNIVCRFL